MPAEILRLDAAGEPDLVGEVRQIFAGATAAGLSLKVMGGLGCWLHVCDHGEDTLGFRRRYKDIDLMVRKQEARQTGALLQSLGYDPVASFNAVQGETRQMFVGGVSGTRVDIFLEQFAMCHRIPIGEGAFGQPDHPSLGLAELLLMKLQIVKVTDNDLLDAASILAFHDFGDGPDQVDLSPIVAILSRDWGLWKTVTTNMSKLVRWSTHAPARSGEIAESVKALLDAVDRTPKSTRWKLRARVGERMPWYEEPEEPTTEWQAVE